MSFQPCQYSNPTYAFLPNKKQPVIPNRKLPLFCYFPNIDLDDEELSCEGLQSILIDWQGGFVGSVANDLMWAIYPFLEANSGKQVSFFYFFK